MLAEKQVLSSPLKWAGGKSWLVPKMKEIYGKHRSRRWVDLFAGSCTLPLALQPQEALVCDAMPYLIDFWKWVQTDGKVTRNFQFDSEYYYSVRDLFNEEHCPQLFYYLIKSCYNGLARFNLKGGFNTPIGRPSGKQIINYMTDFSEYKQAIADWEFKNLDFRESMLLLKEDDFVYADPPYDETFTGYWASFTRNEQITLAEKLSRHPGPVIASNSATNWILDLYSDLGFKIEIVEVTRHISCKVQTRNKAKEMLAFKNLD